MSFELPESMSVEINGERLRCEKYRTLSPPDCDDDFDPPAL